MEGILIDNGNLILINYVSKKLTTISNVCSVLEYEGGRTVKLRLNTGEDIEVDLLKISSEISYERYYPPGEIISTYTEKIRVFIHNGFVFCLGQEADIYVITTYIMPLVADVKYLQGEEFKIIYKDGSEEIFTYTNKVIASKSGKNHNICPNKYYCLDGEMWEVKIVKSVSIVYYTLVETEDGSYYAFTNWRLKPTRLFVSENYSLLECGEGVLPGGPKLNTKIKDITKINKVAAINSLGHAYILGCHIFDVGQEIVQDGEHATVYDVDGKFQINNISDYDNIRLNSRNYAKYVVNHKGDVVEIKIDECIVGRNCYNIYMEPIPPIMKNFPVTNVIILRVTDVYYCNDIYVFSCRGHCLSHFLCEMNLRIKNIDLTGDLYGIVITMKDGLKRRCCLLDNRSVLFEDGEVLDLRSEPYFSTIGQFTKVDNITRLTNKLYKINGDTILFDDHLIHPDFYENSGNYFALIGGGAIVLGRVIVRRKYLKTKVADNIT